MAKYAKEKQDLNSALYLNTHRLAPSKHRSSFHLLLAFDPPYEFEFASLSSSRIKKLCSCGDNSHSGGLGQTKRCRFLARVFSFVSFFCRRRDKRGNHVKVAHVSIDRPKCFTDKTLVLYRYTVLFLCLILKSVVGNLVLSPPDLSGAIFTTLPRLELTKKPFANGGKTLCVLLQ